MASIIVVSSIAIYANSILNPEGSHQAWQRDIPNFATALSTDDGKVFTMDISGNIYCYESQTGASIWSGRIGGYFDSGLKVAGGRVYGGSELASVNCLDEENGQFQWSFEGWLGNSGYSKRAPDAIVAQGDKVYSITEDGPGRQVTAHNATSGTLLWQGQAFQEPESLGNITDLNTWQVSGRVLSGNPFDGNYVYALGGNFTSSNICVLNTKNGEILWQHNITFTDSWPSVLSIYQGQVIINNGHQILSINTTSGDGLWNIDIGASIYSPTIYQGVLLFGASDGNFYGLDLQSGNLSCQTKVDSQNLFNQTNSDLTTFPIQVNPENHRIYWSFGVTQQNQFKATIVSLDLATCKVDWTKQIQDNTLSLESQAGLVVYKDSVFLTENNALWVFDASNGNVARNQHFDHYILAPIVLGNVVLVASDLQLTAYT